MSAQSEVPVYYLDQDESDSPVYVLTREEARRQKKEGLGYFICHGRKFRLYGAAPLQNFDVKSGHIVTASTITFSEALANVGITEDWESNPAAKVRRAREKVRVYPHVGDSQAVLARGSWQLSEIGISVGN